MKRALGFIFIIILVFSLVGCRDNTPLRYILPISVTRNNVRITIDPRVELISVVQYLSDYDELITKADFQYRSDVDAYFSEFRNHEAVKMYEQMVVSGFKYSTPANFALGLTDGLYMDPDVKLAYHVLWGGGGEEQLKNFSAALRDFSRGSDFHNFYDSQGDFYRDNVYQIADSLGNWDYVTELQEYYGMEYRSFNIIPVPLYGGKRGGGFGPYIEREDSIDIYSVLIGFDEGLQGNIPLYGNKSIFKLIQRHEFSHSFVNRITDMYKDEVMKLEHLIAPIQAEMDAQHYSSWTTCLNEHIVRAVTVRLAFSDSGPEGRRALAQELGAGFVYTDTLADALVEYENNRDQYPDFISFYPRLLEALSGL